MWEAIEKNKVRSRILIGILGAVLVGLGFTIGLAVNPSWGGAWGAVLALVLWLGLYLVAMLQGEQVILLCAGARPVRKEDAPQLWNVVEEMTIAAGLPAPPKVYILDDDAPNAFAVGSRPERAAVVVTSGLLRRLDRDELQGVVAHEIGHIANLDIRFMTAAAVMLGAIVIISDLFLRGFRGGGRRGGSSKGDPRVQIAIFAAALLAAVLAPLFARVLYFACSRRREYLADASGARFSRFPDGLASALEKIAVSGARSTTLHRALVPLLTVNPLQELSASSIFSTHPPTDVRIKVLRSMGGRAGYVDYEAAFRKVQGGESPLIGARTLSSQKSIPARAPRPETKEEALERARSAGVLLDRAASYIPIACACGLSIKLPPQMVRPSVTCPRCGIEHKVPRAEEAAPAAPGGGPPPEAGPSPLPALRFERKGTGWESFKCACGRVVQLSPALAAPSIRCPRCRRDIDIARVDAAPAGGR